MSNNAVTSSAALIELKDELTRLSSTLHTIYELMNADMSQVGQAWQDSKYQEFVEGYKPQINKCEAISERYKEWCVRVLDPTIENAIAVERTDVGGGTSSSSIGSGTGSSGIDSGSSNAHGSKFDRINMGGERTIGGDNTGRNSSLSSGNGGGRFSGVNLG